MINEGIRRTGYDEVSLTSLSTADFSGIEEVVKNTLDDSDCGQLSVSLPSLRVDAFTVGIAAEIPCPSHRFNLCSGSRLMAYASSN